MGLYLQIHNSNISINAGGGDDLPRRSTTQNVGVQTDKYDQDDETDEDDEGNDDDGEDDEDDEYNGGDEDTDKDRKNSNGKRVYKGDLQKKQTKMKKMRTTRTI